MAKRRKGGKSRKQFKIPVVGLLAGLGMAHQATYGATTSALTGNFSAAAGQLKQAVTSPTSAIKAALPYALGLGAYSMAKRRIRPGVNFGPVRIEA